jgi:hypothetical protein
MEGMRGWRGCLEAVVLACCESSPRSADGHANREEKKYDAWHHGLEIAERHRIQAESGVARLPFRRGPSALPCVPPCLGAFVVASHEGQNIRVTRTHLNWPRRCSFVRLAAYEVAVSCAFAASPPHSCSLAAQCSGARYGYLGHHKTLTTLVHTNPVHHQMSR